MIYIRIGSHRARQYAFDAIGRKPQGYWSWQRRSTGGFYAVTEAEYAAIRAAAAGCRWATSTTRLRGPYDDLMETISHF
jgi:hypothetical protein